MRYGKSSEVNKIPLTLPQILTNKETARQSHVAITSYYEQAYEKQATRRVPIDTHVIAADKITPSFPT